MLRLTLILCIGMYAALMIAGEDRGQLRPGLAEAAARAAKPGSNQVTGTAPVVETAEVEVVPAVVAADPVAPQPAAEVVVAEAAATPAAEAEVPEMITELREPIFSLSAVGNEAVPGAEGAAEATATDTAARETAPETVPDGQGTIWYVNASSVNVRAEPSTSAEIVGRLGTGEATLVVQSVDDDWARIVIQGDGVEGFVAMRYLSAEAP